MSTFDIPFLDLVTPHRALQQELLSVFRNALDTAGFIGGPVVEEFEREFAQFCDVPYCVGVGSGTDALQLALLAAGVAKDDIVITVPNTFIATTEAITRAGATPKFIDIDERTYTIDTAKLQQYIETACRVNARIGVLEHRATGQRVSAIVPVHIYGQMADMDTILEQAECYGLRVIEDACQAHGATYLSRKDGQWHKAGSMGMAAAFSFYPGKNLGACGEAGAVTTISPQVAARVRMLRDHGQAKKYYHEIEGYNGRLDAIQAGILRVKLQHVPRWNEQRRECAAEYDRLFRTAGSTVRVPYEPSWSRAVYHVYVISSPDRDALTVHLQTKRIGTGVHYPIPLHLQKAYAHLGYQVGDFPVAEKAAAEVLSLPIFPNLTPEQQQIVVAEVQQFIESEQLQAAARS